MDAFQNYNNLYAGLMSDISNKDASVRAIAEQKGNADDMAKSLGEVKAFLSGSHGAKSFVKEAKAIAKKKAEKLAKEAKQKLQQKAEDLAERAKARLRGGRDEAQSNSEDAQQQVTDRAEGNPQEGYDDWDTPWEGADEGEDEQNVEPEAEDTGVAQDGYDEWDIPGTGDANEYDDWDTPWGGDTLEESRAGTFSNPIANTRSAATNPVNQDSQVSLETRPSEEPPSYEESFDASTQEKGALATEGEAPPPAFEPKTSTSTGATQTEVKGVGSTSDATTQANLDSSLAKTTAEKTAGKTAGKVAGEEAGEEAGAEAGLSILDAIPGLDVLGFIGGGILAAIEAHKQKKEEEAESDQRFLAPTQAVQVGVGGE